MNFQAVLVLLICGIKILEAGEFFHSNGTKFYVSYPWSVNWFKAQRYCTYYGMHLVSIHSYEEEQIILEIIERFKTKNNLTTTPHIHFYTGGIDMGHTNFEFYWTSTGYPVIYSDWISHEFPIVSDISGNCVLLDGDRNNKWHNVNCTRQYNFICQNRITVPEITRYTDCKYYR